MDTLEAAVEIKHCVERLERVLEFICESMPRIKSSHVNISFVINGTEIPVSSYTEEIDINDIIASFM